MNKKQTGNPSSPARSKASRSEGTAGASSRRASGAAPKKATAAPAGKSRARSEQKSDAAKRKPITREQSLATIRALVEAKKQRAKQPPPWPGADPHQHRAPDATAPAEVTGPKPGEPERVEPERRAQRDRHETRGVR